MSQTLTWVPPAETNRFPPGYTTPASTGSPCSMTNRGSSFLTLPSLATALPPKARSHNLILLSEPAVIHRSEAPGPGWTVLMASSWASTTHSNSEVTTSQMRSFPSRHPVAARERSAVANAALVTASPWSLNLRSTLFDCISMTAHVPLVSPANISLPSLRQAAQRVTSLNLERLATSSGELPLPFCHSATFVPLTTATLKGFTGRKETSTTRVASFCFQRDLKDLKCWACGSTLTIRRDRGKGWIVSKSSIIGRKRTAKRGRVQGRATSAASPHWGGTRGGAWPTLAATPSEKQTEI
mmetsp:Transcript_18167/g.38846  ORF Transcript_18167/g.38846 Transcript_18167/m.38846 type:complete len:298 (-) Transcript_18167:27-920(-)